MGKTSDLFTKIGDIKGIFHARMDMIKDRNSKDLIEGGEIKKRWQEYTEELYQKDLNDLDNHNGVSTHLKPDILECEVKWALGNITTNKASGDDGIPGDYFKSKKMMLLKCCTQYVSIFKIWKTQQWPQDWKRLVFIPIPKKGSAKECSSYHTIALIFREGNGNPLRYS